MYTPYVLTNFASTCSCVSLSVTAPPPKTHLSLVCIYFSAPKNDFAHLKMNYSGFLHPRSQRKVPYSAVWARGLFSNMDNKQRISYQLTYDVVSLYTMKPPPPVYMPPIYKPPCLSQQKKVTKLCKPTGLIYSEVYCMYGNMSETEPKL